MSDPTAPPDAISALRRLTEPAVQGALQSDAELLTLFVESGSRMAIEVLIQRYAGMVASVCRCTVSDPASAEDAFQATFLVLLKSAKKIQKRGSLAAWLHGVAYRTGCRLRKQRLANFSALSADEVIEPNQSDEDPINVLARKLELEALDQELQKLPQGLREILVEHYLLGYSAPQIAERTALSVSAIEGRIRRGRYALLRQLARRGISLTVLVAASSWFQQHLQAAQADEWTETFLDSYLPEVASPTGTDFETHSDTISSLIRGEMNMFNATFLKAAYSAGGALLFCGLIAFNLFDDGNQPSAGLTKSHKMDFAFRTMPQETNTVVAQIADPAKPLAGSSGAPPDAPKSDVELGLNVAIKPSESDTPVAGSNAAAKVAAESETRQPIQWQVAEGEPPSWLQSPEVDQAEREMREQVRSKLGETIVIDCVGAPLQQVLTEVGDMTNLTILLDTDELGNVGIDPESPVTINGSMSLREFLRRLFKSVGEGSDGLAYTVHESNIEITSVEGANADPAIRYYDLAYVLPNDTHLPSVISAIEQTISTDSWTSAGGTYTISPVGSMLIISCDEPSHQKIEEMLSRIAAMNKVNLEKASAQRLQPTYQGGMGMGGGGMF